MEDLPDRIATQRREAQSISAITFCNAFLTAYGKGEITFVKFSRHIDNVLSNTEYIPVPLKITGNSGEDININDHLFAHQLLLGNFIYEALRCTPPKRKKGNTGQPRFIRRTSILLVKSLKGTGHNISRIGKKTSWGMIPTAFDFVADFWKKAGIKGVTPTAVEKWCATKSKNTTKKKKRRVTK